MGLTVGTALSVAGLIEFFIHRMPYHDHMLATLPVQIGLAYFTSAALHFRLLPERHTIPFALTMVVLVEMMGGLVLGGLGGFDGPFFYSIYMMPTFIMLVPCKLHTRILGTFAVLVGFFVLFIIQQETITWIAPDITGVSVLIIASACVLLGHRDWIVSRERALAMYRLDHDREQTRARNNELADRVRSQAVRARSLANELSEVREFERLNLARDLHDDVGQLLVGAKMEVELLEHKRSRDESLELEELERLYDVMFGLEDGIREMIRRLRMANQPFELRASLEELLAAYGDHCVIEDNFGSAPLDDLPNEVDHLVYRVVQEGLTNAAKYSDGERLWISVLRREDDALCVSVEDDGSALERKAEGEGWGVLGLRERAKALGGDVRLYRDVRDGVERTILEALLPCPVVSFDGRAPVVSFDGQGAAE